MLLVLLVLPVLLVLLVRPELLVPPEPSERPVLLVPSERPVLLVLLVLPELLVPPAHPVYPAWRDQKAIRHRIRNIRYRLAWRRHHISGTSYQVRQRLV